MLAHPPSADPSLIETRQRLLEAAGEVFAEHGFRAATIRDIARRAGANVAAVNYHFRDKLGLYKDVLRLWAGEATEKYPPTLGLGPHPTVRQRLHAFVHSFLLRIMDEGRPAWHGKVMAREIMDPTEALDELVEHHMRPLNECLTAIIRDLVGRDFKGPVLARCTCSVISQCLFYHHARPVIERLHPEIGFTRRELGTLADHITDFSMGGLTALANRKIQKGAR